MRAQSGSAAPAALTDLIHGALYGGSSWQDFLDRARQLLPNGQAVLFFHDDSAGAIPLSAGSDDGMIVAYNEHYSKINPWMPHAAVRPLKRFVQADEMLPRRALEMTEYYNDYLRPQDIHTGFGVTIRRDNGCNFLFSVVCADVDEAQAIAAKATLQAVVPHLSRAFDYYRRDPRVTSVGLGWDEQAVLPKARGVMRVGPESRVLYADAQALRLAEQSGCLSIGLFNKLACTSSIVAEYVSAELNAWEGGKAPPSTRTFHLRREGGALPLRVTVFRPGGTGVAFFRGPECLLLIEDPAVDIEAAAEEFAAMYGLSRSERRVAGGLAAGLTLPEIATQNGTALETVRTQLGHIFSKTGLGRQTDLARHICVMAGALHIR